MAGQAQQAGEPDERQPSVRRFCQVRGLGRPVEVMPALEARLLNQRILKGH